MDLFYLAFTARFPDLFPVQGLYMTGLDLASLPQAIFRHLPMLRLSPVLVLKQYWIITCPGSCPALTCQPCRQVPGLEGQLPHQTASLHGLSSSH